MKTRIRYWVMAPVEATPAKRFDEVWQFDIANNCISIGWHKLDKFLGMSWQELFDAIAEKYRGERSPKRGADILSNFLQMKSGDWVIVRRGIKVIMAVGKVTESAEYMPNKKNPAINHKHFLRIEWQDSPRNMDLNKGFFRRVHRISGREIATTRNMSPGDKRKELRDLTSFCFLECDRELGKKGVFLQNTIEEISEEGFWVLANLSDMSGDLTHLRRKQ